jgi:hyaluronan synthase
MSSPLPQTESAPERTSPSASGHGWIGWVVAFAVIAVLITYRVWAYSLYGISILSIFFTVVATFTVLMFFLAARGFDSYASYPVPRGRIVAIVPTYNEDQASLYAAVRALLDSTVAPDVIHVVDDGSIEPVVPFDHPGVVWHRQQNAGKRAAQALVLMNYTVADVDFIVTVDSDSRVAPTAIEDALRPMNDEKVQAVTSIVVVRNRLHNLLALISDLEITSGIYVTRRARAALGAVTPTSGAFSVYRSAPILDHLYDYVTSGTFSDDRRLAHYCLMRGKVVSVNGAIVDTDMPTSVAGTWRQRVRWYKGYWKYLPWEMGNLTGWPVTLRFVSALTAAVFPIVVLWAAVVMPLTGRGFFWPLLLLWLALLYAQSLTYLRRPSISKTQAWATWLFITPLLIPYQLLLIRPAMYWAALTVTSDRWDGHREPAQFALTTP